LAQLSEIVKTDIYVQNLKQAGGKNIYTILRSEDGYGGECNAFTVPRKSFPSVVSALSFIYGMKRSRPNWLSKDLLIIFYEDLPYASGV
jgi:hypothetical protein